MVDFSQIQAVPSGTTNGAPLPNQPANASAVVIYIPAAASISYAIAGAQPTSAPTTATVAGNATGGATSVIVERLAPLQNVIVTATTGTIVFRWLTGG